MTNYGDPGTIAQEKTSKTKLIKVLAGGVLGVVVFLTSFMVGCMSMVTIPAGHVGVVTKFGRVTGQMVYEGMHFLNPVVAVEKMDTRTIELKEKADVPSAEGLLIGLEASLLFHLDPAAAPKVYQSIGVDYRAKVVEPILRSAMREATASHSANALYSKERDQVQAEIVAAVTSQLGVRGIVVERILLRDIALPAALKSSIESKQQAEQESLAMQFRLQKEKQEADRKRIEAQGIKDFQAIVSQGISEPLLRWKGIEATEKLAYSPNSKIVIIGSGKDGMPLILGH
jgi:regulator of protease activity HflC (stomatin/prohibitin superfamily)